MGHKLKFADGEKVLCFHGPLIYEAKCLKSSISKDKTVKYFIHYAGWNKNWDEWVPESRVLKYNEANVQKQKEVQSSHRANPIKATAKKSKARKAEPAVEEAGTSTPVKEETPKAKNKEKEVLNDSSSESSKKKRARLDPPVEQAVQDESEQLQIQITLPDDLKRILVDDWYMITNQHKLVSLPAKPTITQIFHNYISSAKFPDDENVCVVEGIKDYFNFTLGKQLLYESEQAQFRNMVMENEDRQMSDLYGLIHLLRMFTKFGSMLAQVDVGEKAKVFILDFVKKFLLYVSTNKADILSVEDYISK